MARNHGGEPSSWRSDLCEQWREPLQVQQPLRLYRYRRITVARNPGSVPAGVSRRSQVKGFAPPPTERVTELQAHYRHAGLLQQGFAPLWPAGSVALGASGAKPQARQTSHRRRDFAPPPLSPQLAPHQNQNIGTRQRRRRRLAPRHPARDRSAVPSSPPDARREAPIESGSDRRAGGRDRATSAHIPKRAAPRPVAARARWCKRNGQAIEEAPVNPGAFAFGRPLGTSRRESS